MPTILDAKNNLATYFFQTAPNPWVNAIGVGTIPADESKPTLEALPQILVLVGPAAPCELEAIQNQVKQRAGDFPFQLLSTSRFEGLQGVATGSSISPYSFRYSLPRVSAGTFGGLAKAGGKEYVLGANHAMAHNGRAPVGTDIASPGTIDDVTGGAVIGSLSHFVKLDPPEWPLKGTPKNQVDCALAEIPNSGLVNAPNPLSVFSPSGFGPVPVSKKGRSTNVTNSQIRIWSLEGYVDFSFGAFYFSELMGTYETSVFASPGDSGAMVTTSGNQGVGLVMARAYVFDLVTGAFKGYIIAICSLTLVKDQLVTKAGAPAGIDFFV